MHSLRRQIAIVFQDAGLMSGTILENIALDDSIVTIDQIETAARQAQIHDFITTLPQQYNYDVGPCGVLLSSGQRQRIAIARALLRDSAVLILDEATSNLDMHTEQQVMKAIQQRRYGRTTIVITHRLPVAQFADQIIILHGGQICEQGAHNELITKGSRYYNMWKAFSASSTDSTIASNQRTEINSASALT